MLYLDQYNGKTYTLVEVPLNGCDPDVLGEALLESKQYENYIALNKLSEDAFKKLQELEVEGFLSTLAGRNVSTKEFKLFNEIQSSHYDFHIVAIDETLHWDDKTQEQLSTIYGLYLIDKSKITYCSEITPSYAAYEIGNFFDVSKIYTHCFNTKIEEGVEQSAEVYQVFSNQHEKHICHLTQEDLMACLKTDGIATYVNQKFLFDSSNDKINIMHTSLEQAENSLDAEIMILQQTGVEDEIRYFHCSFIDALPQPQFKSIEPEELSYPNDGTEETYDEIVQKTIEKTRFEVFSQQTISFDVFSKTKQTISSFLDENQTKNDLKL